MASIKLVTDQIDDESRRIESGLQALGICYELICVGDDSGCRARYRLADAPVLVVDDRIVYHGRLNAPDLAAIFAGVECIGKQH